MGKTLALLLARERLKVALVTASGTQGATPPDVRAYALNRTSRGLLESLRSWPDAEGATAVQHMQVQGDRNSGVCFDAATQGVDALAWIVDVPLLADFSTLASGLDADPPGAVAFAFMASTWVLSLLLVFVVLRRERAPVVA